jgi:hypothetical protein
VYRDCGLTLEKYCIFLKDELSDNGVNPTLEKSKRFIFEEFEEGESTT